MFKTISKLAIVVSAVVAMPGMAQAGTATTSGTSTLTVTNQCSVAGANVNLGTFTTNDTWGTVAALNGELAGSLYIPGSRGNEYANFGTITCDNGIPYTFTISGTSGYMQGAVRMPYNGGSMLMTTNIKKIGAKTMADSFPNMSGAGALGWPGAFPAAAATGTGAPQAVLGSIYIYSGLGGFPFSSNLSVAGSFSDTLTYTLNF